MARPKMSPKMQNKKPIVSSLWPSMPRNEICERSGSFKPASPPTVSGADWARAAVPFNNIRAAHTAPALVNRLRSEHAPASQVDISDPPSRILNPANSRSFDLALPGGLQGKTGSAKHQLPAHHFALEFVLQGVERNTDRICCRLPLQDWIGVLPLAAANKLRSRITASLKYPRAA